MIALAVGAVLAGRMGEPTRMPFMSLLAFWYSFGGHWVEVWFLNWLRPHLSAARAAQVAARVAVWFAGGTGLGLGAALTAMLLAGIRPSQWPAWWFGGLGLVALELVVHLLLRLRGRPNFYDGRG